MRSKAFLPCATFVMTVFLGLPGCGRIGSTVVTSGIKPVSSEPSKSADSPTVEKQSDSQRKIEAPSDSQDKSTTTQEPSQPINDTQQKDVPKPVQSEPVVQNPLAAKMADAFVESIGVATHLHYNDTVYNNFNGIIKPKLVALGVRHIRDGMSGDQWYADRINELGKLGIKSCLSVDPRNYANPATAVAHAKMVLSSLDIVEGSNELDIAGLQAQQIVEYQKNLYNAFKADPVTSSLPVAMGSMAHSDNFKKLCAAVPCPYSFADIGNMHPYPGGQKPSAGIDTNLQNAKLAVGNKPIIATETGYHTSKLPAGAIQPGVSEVAAGKYIGRLWFEYFNRGIKIAYAYELIDEWAEATPTDAEKHFGLLRNDGSEKPAFVVTKNIISLLKDPGPAFTTEKLDFSLSGASQDIHTTVLQKRDKSFYLVIWNEVASYDLNTRADLSVAAKPVVLNLNKEFSQVSIFQPYQSTNAIAEHQKTKQITLQVPDHPLIVRLVP